MQKHLFFLNISSTKYVIVYVFLEIMHPNFL